MSGPEKGLHCDMSRIIAQPNHLAFFFFFRLGVPCIVAFEAVSKAFRNFNCIWVAPCTCACALCSNGGQELFTNNLPAVPSLL